MSSAPRRLVLDEWAGPGNAIAARVLDRTGTVVGVVPEPADATDIRKLRDAIVDMVFDTDFGDVILAGVAFAPRLGGDAVGFT